MMRPAMGTRLATGFAIGSLLLSSAATAAPVLPRSVDPLVAVSFLGTSSSRAAVCAAGAASMAASAAAQATPTRPGCVLPVVDAAAVVQPEPAPPPPPEPVYAAPAPAGGIGAIPLLLGLAAIVAAVVLLWDDADDDFINFRPISPG